MKKDQSAVARALHRVETIDLAVARKASIPKDETLGEWTRRFAELGDQPPLVAISLAVIAAGIAGGNDRLRRTGLRMLTAHSLSTIAKQAGKDRIDRTRPGALNEKSYRLEKGASHDGRLRSMPSGHSAGTVAIAGAIAADYPGARLALGGVSAAVAAAQVPSRNHYLSDVVVGAAIGFLVSRCALLLIPSEPAKS